MTFADVCCCCCVAEKRFSHPDYAPPTEMASTTMKDSWPPTNNTTPTPAANCSDPEQACYYAQILRVVNVLDLYLIPLISVVGCIGNILSFLIFTTTYLRRLSSSVYLAALAVADTIFLLVLFCSSLRAVGIQVSGNNTQLVRKMTLTKTRSVK